MPLKGEGPPATRRLFFALGPDAEVGDRIEDLQRRLRERADGRWVARGNFHLTIAFLGNVTADQVGLCRHFLRNLKWVQSDFRSKKLATRFAFGCPRRPASHRLARCAATVLHHELDGLSVALCFVFTCSSRRLRQNIRP